MACAVRLAKPSGATYLRAGMNDVFYMDAVITPHRSLSKQGFIILICALTTIDAISAGFFLFIGAGPVPIFLGLDLLAVAIAFSASNRAAARKECIRVTAAEVRVVSRSPRGEETLWVSPTAFTRVTMRDDERGEEEVCLRLSDQSLRVARALSHPERLAFAKALDLAIWRARSGQPLASDPTG